MQRIFFNSLLFFLIYSVTSCDDGNSYISQVNNGNYNNSVGTPTVDICNIAGENFGFGVSSYGSLRSWATDAISSDGVPFHYLYIYILAGGMDNPDDFRDWYIKPFIDDCIETGANPVFSFYQLLNLADERGFTGTEYSRVQGCLSSPDCMNNYFNNFKWFLEILAEEYPSAIIDVEPDSWGFMMWAMGTEGLNDSSAMYVAVDESLFPEVRGFPNTAGGFGKALLAIRNAVAPNVLMGWHSSNFRAGTRPDVVSSFYSGMGNWDLLFCENFHFEGDENVWWEDWDADAVQTNLEWASHVTSETGLPMLLWQIPIGSWDWHLLGRGNYDMLKSLTEAGIIGVLFDHQNHQGGENPDDFRAEGSFGTVPPTTSEAGGTALDMKNRVLNYASNPISLSDGTSCP